MKTIAHVLRKYDPHQWGGTESLLLTQALEFRKQGIDFHFFAPKLSALSKKTVCPFLKHAFQVTRYKAYLPKIGLSKKQKQKQIDIGGNIISFDLMRKLLKLKPDIIHSHAINRIAAMSRFAAKKINCPFIVSIHGGYLNMPNSMRKELATIQKKGLDYGKLVGFFYNSRNVLALSDKIIAINLKEAELLKTRYKESIVHYIPNFIETQVFENFLKLFPEKPFSEKLKLVTVARIDPSKNQLWILNNWSLLKKHVPNLEITFVGPATNSEYASKFKKMIQKLRDVHYHGQVAPRSNALFQLIHTADAMFLPSLSEPFGIVVLESWALKTPVIASKVGGLIDLVEQAKDGYLFESENIQSLLNILKNIKKEKAPLKILGKNGHEKLKNHYCDKKVCSQLKDLYEESYLKKQQIVN